MKPNKYELIDQKEADAFLKHHRLMLAHAMYLHYPMTLASISRAALCNYNKLYTFIDREYTRGFKLLIKNSIRNLNLKSKRVIRSYHAIIQRCYNHKNPAYKDYGGRGIKMFEGWRSDRSAYVKYVYTLDNCGVGGYSVDRIDNDGDYTPGNLRYATPKQQNDNRRQHKHSVMGRVVNGCTVIGRVKGKTAVDILECSCGNTIESKIYDFQLRKVSNQNCGKCRH